MREFGTTIFAEMSALAEQTGSINLGQGFPDADGPPEILAAAAQALAAGHNQYPPGPGIAELRAAIAHHHKRFYGLDVDIDAEVLVTAGATEAIASALLALVDDGDEVLMFEPYYDSYGASVALARGVRRVVTLDRDGAGWTFDADRFRASVTARTRVILLNTPHNPTGKVFSRTELQVIADVACERDLIVISDEVYEHLVFDGEHVPIATLPGMADRTITIGSAGKSFSVTGWKIGWATGPAELVSAVRTVKQFLTYASGAPLQHAVAHALGLPDQYYRNAAESLKERRDVFCGGLSRAGFDVVAPQATYFATVSVDELAADYCRRLPASSGVVAIPSSVFYDSTAGDHFVRFAFCKRPEVLAEAVRRLERGS